MEAIKVDALDDDYRVALARAALRQAQLTGTYADICRQQSLLNKLLSDELL